MWEYTIVVLEATSTNAEYRVSLLDNAGAEEWELVAVVFNPNTGYMEYTFKKQVSGIRFA